MSDKSCSCLTVVLLFNAFYNLSGLFIIIKLFTKKRVGPKLFLVLTKKCAGWFKSLPCPKIFNDKQVFLG